MDSLAHLTLQLCGIDGTTGKEKASVDFLELFLKEQGWKTQRQPVGPEKGRDNLWAFASEMSPKVIFCTHVDTVPAFIPPALSKDNKSLMGRGVCDAKGIAACLIFAADALKKQGYPVALLLVVGEETTSDGAKAAATFGVKSNYIVVGEPSQLKLVRAMKGVVAFELNVTGKAGHSAYPEVGYSAVHHLIQDLNKLLQLPWPQNMEIGETTCNIGTIQGGRASNVIADTASAKCCVRATVKVEEIINLIRSTIHPKTELTILSCSDPQYLKVVDGIETTVVSFGSDVPYLRSIAEPLLAGPGSILEAHTIHEHIQIQDLHAAVDLYIKLGITLCNSIQ